jgi:hypothetical protein
MGVMTFARELKIAAQNINAYGVEAAREVRAMPDGGKAANAESDAYVQAIKDQQCQRRQRKNRP